jgi:GNAT superfamily N-acetyltransferase
MDTEIRKLIKSFCSDKINDKYVNGLVKLEGLYHMFLSFEDKLDIKSSPCMLTYVNYWFEETNEMHFYVLLLCTNEEHRGKGYATTLLKLFKQYIQDMVGYSEFTTKVILSSVEDAVTFYEDNGFKWVWPLDKSKYDMLLQYEYGSFEKECFVMEMDLTQSESLVSF